MKCRSDSDGRIDAREAMASGKRIAGAVAQFNRRRFIRAVAVTATFEVTVMTSVRKTAALEAVARAAQTESALSRPLPSAPRSACEIGDFTVRMEADDSTIE